MSDRFCFDPAGFPLVHVEALDAYLHWLPVTKIQFETFLSDEHENAFDHKWYVEVLGLNPRVTASRIDSTNYWNAFLTGIRPSEAEAYAAWARRASGGTNSLPTKDEWITAYDELKQVSAIEVSDLTEMSPSPRARALIVSVANAVGSDKSLADQMLLRGGVMEWVKCPSRREPWGGFGRPNGRFFRNLYEPDTGKPSVPLNPEQLRLPPFGFRLLHRPMSSNSSPGAMR